MLLTSMAQPPSSSLTSLLKTSKLTPLVELLSLTLALLLWPTYTFFLDLIEARYEPISFSDHLAYIVSFSLPSPMARILSPRARPLYKIKPDVIKDKLFQERLSGSMLDWQCRLLLLLPQHESCYTSSYHH